MAGMKSSVCKPELLLLTKVLELLA